MAERKPLVLIGSTIRQLPTGDTVEGATGPTGPQGPAGPTGPTGPQGPAGEGSMPLVRTPTNVTPANGATGVDVAPTLTANAYGSVYGITQQGSRWQIDTTSDFASPVYDSGDLDGEYDPHSTSVSLAAHFDNTFADLTGKTITAYGNAYIGTAQSKFGGASACFDGSGDYLTAPTQTAFAFGTADFTVECWVRPSSVAGLTVIYDGRTGAVGSAAGMSLSISSGTLRCDTDVANVLSGGTLVAYTWYHVALTRDSGTFRLWLDGVQVSTSVAVYNLMDGNVTIGAYGGAQFFNGYIDDFRITKGVARYTTAFTPPTSAFLPISHSTGVVHVVPSNLAANTLHYWRCMYRDSDNVDSAWSTGTSFTTA